MAIDGLSSTASAIQRGQQRFDAKAEAVVADSYSLAEAPASDPDPLAAAPAAAPAAEAPAGDLASSVVGLREEQLVNSILYGVFRRQADQQRQAADLLAPPK